MRVLTKMTIDAVHSFLEMNVIQMNSLSESIGIVRRHNLVSVIQQIPFPIALEHLAKHPAMTVEIGKLRALELAVEPQSAGLIQKFRFGPQPAQARGFGIAVQFSLFFALRRIMLISGIHSIAIRLVVPPDQTEIRRHHIFAGMYMTDHALRSWNAARQLMFDGMTRFIFRNADVGAL